MSAPPPPSVAPPPPLHGSLRGMERLRSVVSCLSVSCPWTRSVPPLEMLGWLRGELDELRSEVEEMKDLTTPGRGGTGAQGDGTTSTADDARRASLRRALVSEMGDVLFDALMLEMMVRREFGFGEDEAWDAACEKVERRTPYMEEWGDGSSRAHTADEAERIWQAAKEEEKRLAREQETGQSSTGREIRLRNQEKRVLRFPFLSTDISFRNSLNTLSQLTQSPIGTAAAGLVGFWLGMLVSGLGPKKKG